MKSYVLDTHPLYWYLTESPKLGKTVEDLFDAAARGEVILVIPAIVLVELLAVYEKYKPNRDFHTDLAMLKNADQFHLLSFDPEDVELLIPTEGVLELHDRMVVACAKTLNLPCITKDSQIVGSKLIETIW